MQPDSVPRKSFGREFLENLGLQVGGALTQVLLLLTPAVIGYLVGDVLGLMIGLAVGAVLVALFWVLVLALGLGGLADRLRRR